jgi:putative nucleotidyltransferase with HDIG domain
VTGRIRLQGVGEPIQGLHWESNQLLRIGRAHNLDIVLRDPSIGRLHAEIRVTPSGWIVHDRSVTLATRVNGMRVEAAGRQLQKDDLLQCGKLVFLVSELELERSPAKANLPTTQGIKATGSFLRIQAQSQLSWEQRLTGVSVDHEEANPANHFLALLRAGYHLSRIDSVPELLQSLLDDIVAVLNARGGAILLLDEAAGTLCLKNTSGPHTKEAGRCYSKTLVERCFAKGESLLCVDSGLSGATSLGHSDRASIICGLLRSPRRRLGVLFVDRSHLQEPFTENDFRLVDAIAVTVSVGIESAMAVAKEREESLQEAVGMAWRALEVRDADAAAHCRRVSIMAAELANGMALSVEEQEWVKKGALLHDLGNIGMPDVILQKRGSLTPAETQVLRTHVLKGVAIAERYSGLGPILPIIRHHHEHWDGTGYPDGLQGEGIPRPARLVAVVDILDELLTGTTGPMAMAPEQAFGKLREAAGRTLDPHIVEAALQLQSKLQGA